MITYKELQIALDLIAEEGHLSPTLLAKDKDGKQIVMKCGEFSSEDSVARQLCEFTIRMALYVNDIEQFIFISEAWTSSYKPDELPVNLPRPSEDPNRQECVIFVEVSAAESKANQYLITRDDTGKILGLNEHTKDMPGSATGRIPELLPDEKFKKEVAASLSAEVKKEMAESFKYSRLNAAAYRA